MTPSGIWVTHPTNNIRNNHVSGSDFYRFLIEIFENPMGPSATDVICP